MAYGVKDPRKLRVHQALHGYADGHRQLAISTPLKAKDQKILLALSDISGSGAKIDEEGYLTGYPLTDSGFFALARTWPAPEMPRPGCVWTHTLLIDFNDLATVESLNFLNMAFRRPDSLRTPHDYMGEALIESDSDKELSSSAIAWSRYVLTSLYGKPKSKIVIARSVSEVDEILLSVWSQQWPRLRRGFRFCTFSANDRSSENSPFDLQVLPALDRGARSRFGDAIYAENIKPAADDWVKVALYDLKYPDESGLRTFFRRLGSDVAGGREIFRSLCRLHRTISVLSQEPEAINEAIALLQNELANKPAKLARSILVKAAAFTPEVLNDASFDFLWSNLGLIESADIDITASKIGQAAWRRHPERFIELLDRENDPNNVLFERFFSGLTTESLLEGLENTPGLLSIAFARRPELITEQKFWEGDEEKTIRLMGVAKELGLQVQAIQALLLANRSDLAQVTCSYFDSAHVLEALAQTPDISKKSLRDWIKTLKIDNDIIAGFLASHSGIHRRILHAIAQTLLPDSVPNNYGDDPWFVAWSRSVGRITEPENDFLMAYFLSRALGFRSRSQAELIQVSLDTVHSALACDRLSYESWRHLDALLPWSILWFAWDRCQRLLAGIANTFVARDLMPLYFAKITDNESLFYAISNNASQSSRGRSYLIRVLNEMERDEERFSRRILIIKNFVK